MSMRPMRWTDIDVLVGLDVELFGADAWSAATWWAELRERPRRDYAVVPDGDDHPLAYAGLDLGGDVADIMTIGVSPRAQGQGLGGQLLRWMVERAVEDGAIALILEVRESNEAARTLYEHNGFERISVRRGYYQPGGEDALVLRRLLR
ncbi:ribosomal protein S18-alanine N-acetyltransferase [Demetria terragena]|uniref:ribosomal protein S18-alanine N-acetyltransferase n=1 Tax=Demetria terragena TaxID=63959 RepID=UPI0012E99461|nr:ribosomal protein S18-alanine N-acetyltransferase [Demetria terragena]